MAGSAIVLAAGGSRRMGRPKALLDWGGRPLVVAHVLALAAAVDRVVVVVGAHADAVRAVVPPGIGIVENPDWAGSGPSDSARLGAAGLAAPVLVTPVDVSPAPPSLARRLLAHGRSAVPVDPSGRDRHPVVLDAADLARLLSGAPLPEGLRTLLGDADRIAAPEGPAADFDDPAAYAAAVGLPPAPLPPRRGTEVP